MGSNNPSETPRIDISLFVLLDVAKLELADNL